MKKVLGISVLLLAFVVAGFAQSAVVRTDNSQRSSDRISREVRHEVLMLPYYSVFDAIQYQVNGDTVTLSGAVTNPTLKSDAENAVKKIEGVEQVKNTIDVLPPSSMGDQIRRRQFRA